MLDPSIYDGNGVPHGNLAALTSDEVHQLAAYVRGLVGPGQFPCGADLNCDKMVDLVDLLELLGKWGPCPLISTCPADIDDSGEVDVNDLLILLANWG